MLPCSRERSKDAWDHGLKNRHLWPVQFPDSKASEDPAYENFDPGGLIEVFCLYRNDLERCQPLFKKCCFLHGEGSQDEPHTRKVSQYSVPVCRDAFMASSGVVRAVSKGPWKGAGGGEPEPFRSDWSFGNVCSNRVKSSIQTHGPDINCDSSRQFHLHSRWQDGN